MKTTKYRFGVGILVLLLTALILYQRYSVDESRTAQAAYTPLQRSGDECDSVSSKAAMHLPEVLPFQKLEKAARQSRVLVQCMNDHGYVENPKWVQYAEPVVAQEAKAAGISVNEAMETLKRRERLNFTGTPGQPSYWIPKSSISD